MKLLKYNDSDAWEKPNLTRDEKAKMIYNGMDGQDNFNVYLDYFMDEATNKEKVFKNLSSWLYIQQRGHMEFVV